MSNNYFQFKQFTIQQDRCAMKVTTDACLFGARVAKEIKNSKLKIKNCLDIGAGTALLSLMFAQKNPNAIIDAIEIDEDSFSQAKENIDSSPWKDRINIFHGDAKHFQFPNQYDVIISNPPFYENELKSDDLKRNLALHNNELSLQKLLSIIKMNLGAEGMFFLLLPYKRRDEIRKIFKTNKLSLEQIILVRQSVNHDYFRIIITGKHENEELTETSFDEISIWDEQQQYTKEFIELLKDCYLYL